MSALYSWQPAWRVPRSAPRPTSNSKMYRLHSNSLTCVPLEEIPGLKGASSRHFSRMMHSGLTESLLMLPLQKALSLAISKQTAAFQDKPSACLDAGGRGSSAVVTLRARAQTARTAPASGACLRAATSMLQAPLSTALHLFSSCLVQAAAKVAAAASTRDCWPVEAEHILCVSILPICVASLKAVQLLPSPASGCPGSSRELQAAGSCKGCSGLQCG